MQSSPGCLNRWVSHVCRARLPLHLPGLGRDVGEPRQPVCMPGVPLPEAGWAGATGRGSRTGDASTLHGWWRHVEKPWSFWGLDVLFPRHAGKPAPALTWNLKQAEMGPGTQGPEQLIFRKGWCRPHNSAPQRGPPPWGQGLSPAPPRRAFQSCRAAGSLGLVKPGCTSRMFVFAPLCPPLNNNPVVTATGTAKGTCCPVSQALQGQPRKGPALCFPAVPRTWPGTGFH